MKSSRSNRGYCSPPRPPSPPRLTFFAIASLAPRDHASAADITSVYWTGDGEDGLWSDGANWNGGAVPGANDAVTIGAGAFVTVNSGSQAADTVSLDPSSTLSIATGGLLTVEATSSMAGNLNLSGGTLTSANGAIVTLAGANNQWGSGTVAGSFAGTGSGTVSMNNGTLKIGSGGATFDFPAGMFQWSGTINVGSNILDNTGYMAVSNTPGAKATLSGYLSLQEQTGIQNDGTITQGANPLVLYSAGIENAADGTYVFDGDGAIEEQLIGGLLNYGLIKKVAGTGTSSISLYLVANTGTVDAESGTISFNGTSSLEQISGTTLTGGNWVVGGTGKLTLPGGNLTENEASVTLNGSGSFPQIAGLTNNSGSFSLLGGASFATTGDLQSPGSLTVGSGSILTVTGNLALASSSNLTIQIGGTAPASFGQMIVQKATTLGGTLSVGMTNGFAPASDDSFSFLSTASYTGAFSSVVPVTQGGGVEFNADYSMPGNVGIDVIAAPFVDLVLSQLNVASQIVRGLPATVTWTVTNAGNEATTVNWNDAVYLSTDGLIDGNAIQLAQRSAAASLPLAPGDSYQASTTSQSQQTRQLEVTSCWPTPMWDKHRLRQAFRTTCSLSA